jgi:hypothetical protein
MSLKAFHILFIIMSVFVNIFFSIWCWMEYLSKNNAFYVMLFTGSVLLTITLIFYGVLFIKNIKKFK